MPAFFYAVFEFAPGEYLRAIGATPHADEFAGFWWEPPLDVEEGVEDITGAQSMRQAAQALGEALRSVSPSVVDVLMELLERGDVEGAVSFLARARERGM